MISCFVLPLLFVCEYVQGYISWYCAPLYNSEKIVPFKIKEHLRHLQCLGFSSILLVCRTSWFTWTRQNGNLHFKKKDKPGFLQIKNQPVSSFLWSWWTFQPNCPVTHWVSSMVWVINQETPTTRKNTNLQKSFLSLFMWITPSPHIFYFFWNSLSFQILQVTTGIYRDSTLSPNRTGAQSIYRQHFFSFLKTG